MKYFGPKFDTVGKGGCRERVARFRYKLRGATGMKDPGCWGPTGNPEKPPPATWPEPDPLTCQLHAGHGPPNAAHTRFVVVLVLAIAYRIRRALQRDEQLPVTNYPRELHASSAAR